MKQNKYSPKILLYRSDSKHCHSVRHLLDRQKAKILEARLLAEIEPDIERGEFVTAIAVTDTHDQRALDFLRSIMRADNLIQRILITSHFETKQLQYAINKAHINYLLTLPLNPDEFNYYLKKAFQRHADLIRPLDKLRILSQITEDLKIDNEKFRVEATTDGLTKLMNRRSFDSIIERLWRRSQEKDFVFSLAMLDIDHFKRVNDTYGHQKGDEVLKGLARVLLDNQRMGMDYAFRHGGEEFALIGINTIAAEMLSYVYRLLEMVRSKSFSAGTTSFQITFSAGISQSGKSKSVKEMIEQADQALYEAKQTGRNRIVVCEEA